ncbi:MAG: transposase, partial [Ruminococcus sp.]|uniref:transposase n=1 Tax=Ruminococcus sp. TaxID=41978 RepID=UPI00344EC05F|nr:transposase [Ruminococcus sp.]
MGYWYDDAKIEASLQEYLKVYCYANSEGFTYAHSEELDHKLITATASTPVAVLEGRDKDTLKRWLEKNKHIKAVTRDRASAYAAAIEETLSAAMQIADRFHLHQNLLEAVRGALNGSIPSTVSIPVNAKDYVHNEDNAIKKTAN